MSKTRLLRPLVVCLLFSLLAPAWVGPAVAAGAGGEIVTVSASGYSLTPEGVTVPGFSLSTTPGQPALPVRGELVPLPPTGDWQLIIEPSPAQLLPERVTIAPAPSPDLSRPPVRPWVELPPDERVVTPVLRTPDPAVYSVDRFYPAQPITAGEVVWQGKQRLLPLRFYPFQYNPVTRELRYYPDLRARVVTRETNVQVEAGQPLRAASPASTGHSVRVATGAAGMHRLTYTDLRNAGVPDGADTSTFAMTYLGAPIDIELVDADGLLSADDLVVFYAEPYRGRYMKNNVYFFWYGGAASTGHMAQRAAAPGAGQPVRDWAYRTVRVEYDEAYWSDYPIPSTADHFFDSPTLAVSGSTPSASITYDLSLPNALTSPLVRFRGQLYGGKEQDADPDQSVQVKLNSHDLGTFTWDGRVGFQPGATAPASYLDATPNQLILTASLAQLPALTDYQVYVDWVELDYPASLVASSDRLSIADLDLGSGTSVDVIASGFSSAAVNVYDVRDPRHPVIITNPETTDTGGAFQVRFRDAWPTGDAAPGYYLSTRAALLAPVSAQPADPPAWNTPANSYDYIAIVHRSLWDAIQPLLDRRAAEGFRIAKVDLQHIYDLYNAGRLDPEAIRAFLTYAYWNWNSGGPPPKYVLLVGDGHYDFKNALNTPQANLVPPYLINIDPWIGETAADNRYVSVDGTDDFLPDMAIGRISAQNATEVTNAVNKILTYEDPTKAPDGAWQDMVSFVADQADDAAGDFQAISEDVRLNWLPPSYSSRHIYWETDYTVAYPDMNNAIKSAFADSFLVQWFGHASRFIWGSTQVFSTFSIASIPASSQWPVSIDYSCWTGYFVNLYNFYGDYRALSEAFLLSADKGSVAAIGPSGQHVGDALQVLNRGFIKSIFTDQTPRIGDAFNAAKAFYYANSTAWPDVIDTTVLFGDPATRLRLIPDAAAPTVAIARSGASPSAANLSWIDLEANSAYQVWRAETPYFDPDTGGSQVGTVDGAGYPPGSTIVFSDADTVGDPAHNYFWFVRGQNVRGPSPNSNRVGEFDFALTRGAP